MRNTRFRPAIALAAALAALAALGAAGCTTVYLDEVTPPGRVAPEGVQAPSGAEEDPSRHPP